MDYQKHYNKLIDRARNRILEGYVEKHHVIPKCMKGTDDLFNIVALTPEEHYIAHLFLAKIYPENESLTIAAFLMSSKNNKNYGLLRIKYQKIISRKMKGRTSPMLGKKHSIETKQKMREAHKGNTNALGYKHSNEAKQKITKSLIGNKRSLGNKPSSETRLKLSNALKGRTYEEIYGKERAEEIRRMRSIKMKGNQNGRKN